MTPTLRPYQIEAIERTLALFGAGRRRVLVVAPTGAGKTVLAAEFIRRMRQRGERALFLAAGRELIEQTSRKLADVDVEHGIIMGGVRPRPGDVQVAIVQALARRDSMPPADLVFIDEADLARAETYSKILAHYPEARVIGLTGTPWRSDGKGLGELFEDVVVAATPRALMDEGFLVEADGFGFVPLDTAGVHTTGGDFNQGELGKRATASDDGARVVGDIVREYQRHAAGRLAVVFGVNIEHSKMLAERFRAEGIVAEHVDGADKDRDAKLDRVRSGETRVICNVQLLTRGVDIPALEVAILARPTKSRALYLQMVGRVLRPSPGKERALILDHAGCTFAHGLPDFDRDYSLTADEKKKPVDPTAAPPITTCRECYAVFATGPTECPACGASLDRVRSGPELIVVDGRAVPFAELRARTNELQAVRLRDLLWDSHVRGWKPQAVTLRFKEEFGSFPSKELVAIARRMANLPAAREAA